MNVMKKNLFTVTVLFILSMQIFANENLPVSLYCEPEFGFLNGTITEYVWRAKRETSGNTIISTPTTKESQLDWQFKNAFYFGANINFTINTHFSFDINCHTVFPGICGIMEDYDWLNPETPAWRNDPPDELTNYSCHKNYLSGFSQIRFLTGYTFILNQKLNLKLTPKFGFVNQKFNFAGQEGYYTYKRHNWKKYNFPTGSTVISYSQNFFAPTTGFAVQIDFLKNFEANGSFLFTYIKKMNAYDDHMQRHNSVDFCCFNDRMEKVYIFDGSLEILYKLSLHNKIGIKGMIQGSPKSYGFTFASITSFDELSEEPISGLGGTSRLLFSYSLVYRLTL